MNFNRLGGYLFAAGLVVIAFLAVAWPIFCGVSAGCGSASW